MFLTTIKKVCMTEDISEVNSLLKEGWVLLDLLSNETTIKFILGYSDYRRSENPRRLDSRQI